MLMKDPGVPLATVAAEAGYFDHRGHFGVYLPPLLEALGLVELDHAARNNRVRAK